MIKETLNLIEGVEYFAIIGFVLFVIGFGFVLLWMSRFDKSVMNEMAQIPIKENASESLAGGKENEI